MSTYYGDLDPGVVLDFKFTTVRDTGLPTNLCSPTLVIFKDNSTTCDTGGVTLTTDFGGRPGLNHVRVDTASCGTFYSAGSNFESVLAAGTVNGVSVAGYTVGAFSIQARAPLRPTVPGQTLDVTAAGRAGVDWGNVENADATVVLTNTTIKTATDVETDTQDLQARVPTALQGGLMRATLAGTSCEPTTVFTWGVDSIETILQWLGVRASNHQTQTATTTTVRNRANDCNIATATASDDGVTATRGSFS